MTQFSVTVSLKVMIVSLNVHAHSHSFIYSLVMILSYLYVYSMENNEHSIVQCLLMHLKPLHPHTHTHSSGVGRCFTAGGLTIVGVSIHFNAGGLGASSPRKFGIFS